MSPQPTTDDENRVQTRNVSWGAAMAALFFVSVGVGFWLRTRWSFGDCVFGQPDCSAAAATWTLVFVTTCAFIAAYEAAMKAGSALIVSRRALDLETKPVLGQWICTNDEHRVPRTALFVTDATASETVPSGHDQNDFVPLEFDFENLGRNALLEVVVTLYLKYEDEPVEPYPLKIGNIATDKDAHVVIYLLWDSPTRPSIGWSSTAIINQKRLEFAALPYIQVEATVSNPIPSMKPDWFRQIVARTLALSVPSEERKWRIQFVESEAEKRTAAMVDVAQSETGAVKRRGGSVQEEEEVE